MVIVYIIFGIIFLIIILLILREVNCWYWKIDERITLMKEQNELLKKIFSANYKQLNIDDETSKDLSISGKTNYTAPDKENDISISEKYTAPEIISQQKSEQSSILKGKHEKIEIEFADGVNGIIYYKKSNNEYFMKIKREWTVYLYTYDSFTNCVNALHCFNTKGEILEEGFIGAFS
jgi:hypothetical protein